MIVTGPLSAATAFLDVARRYCDLVDTAEREDGAQLVTAVEPLLLQLYSAALTLPDPEPSSDEPRSISIGHEEWSATFRRLQAVLGPMDVYREVYDPAAHSDPAGAVPGGDDVVFSSLADDLADIWRELQSGLRLWNPTDADLAAALLGEWRESFHSHWGQHLVDALRTIHWWRHVHHVGPRIAT